MTIKEQIEHLLKDMAGDISGEDQEALDAMYSSCLYAIERWNEPLQYFKKSRE
jgi:hypothetical protein